MIGSLTTQEIEEVLKRNALGRIGCHDGEKSYVVPINYVYEDKFVIAHSVMGMKIEIMRKNPDVCFEVDEIESFTNWKSVIAWGHYQELTDQRARLSAIKLFAERMMHVKVSETAVAPRIVQGIGDLPLSWNAKPIIYRIVINNKTGRFENE